MIFRPLALFILLASPALQAQDISLTPDEQAWCQAHPTIDVYSYHEAAPFGFLTQAGTYVGVVPDIAERIQRLLGIRFVFHGVEYSELLDIVGEGKADMTSLNDPSDRPYEDRYLKTNDFLFLPYSLFVRRDSAVALGKAEPATMTIALCEGWDLNNPSLSGLKGCRFVFAQSVLECINLVVRGEADGIFDVHSEVSFQCEKHSIRDLQIFRMYREGYCAAFFIRKDWPHLQTALNKAIGAIPANEIAGYLKKWNAYLDENSYRVATMNFSDQERLWLREHDVVRVGLDPVWAPLEFMDREGHHQGIAGDFLGRVEEILGIRFERIAGSNPKAMRAQVLNAELDLISCAAPTSDSEANLTFTSSYVSVPVVLIARTDSAQGLDLTMLAGLKVAVVEGYPADEWLARDYPAIQRIAVPSVEAGLQRVDARQVDAYIEALLPATQAMAKGGYTDLRVSAQTPYQYQQAVAVRKDWPILAGLIQKALDRIPPTECDLIMEKWGHVWHQDTVNYRLLGEVLGGVALLLAFFAYWNRRLSRIVAQKTAELKEEYEKRRENDLRFQAIFNQTYQFIGVTSPDGTLQAVNQTALGLADVEAEDVVGKPFWDGPWWDHDAVQRCKVKDAVARAARGEFVRFETTHIDPDGCTRQVDFSLKPVLDHEGNVAMLIPEGRDITDYHRIKKALEQSEGHYRFLFEQNPAPMLIHDCRTLQVLAVNEAFERHYGWTQQEARNLSLIDLHPEQEREKFRRHAEQLSGHAYVGEWHHLKRDGTLMTIVSYSHDLLFEGRDARVNVMTDITQRQRAEEEREQAWAILEAAIAQSPSGIMIADAPDLKIRLVNDAALRIREITSMAFGSENITADRGGSRWQIVHLDGTPYAREDLPLARAVLHGEVTQNREIILLDGAMQKYWLSVNAAPVRNRDGAITAGIVVFHDISEQMRTQAALREQEERYRALYEAAGDAIFIMDKGRFIECNVRMLQMFGCASSDILGASPSKFSPRVQPDGEESEKKARDKIAATLSGKSEPFEWSHVRLDGTVFYVEVSLNAVPMREGTRILGIVRDITERHRAQRELEQEKRFSETVLESVPEMVYVYEINEQAPLESPLVRFNNAHASLTGYSPEELRRLTLRDWFTPRDLPLASDLMASITDKEVVRRQLNLRMKSGAVVPYNCSGRMVELNGKLHFIGSGLDVSEYVWTEQALREREAELQQAQKVGHVGSWRYDFKTNKVRCSDELFRIYEFKVEGSATHYEADQNSNNSLEIVHPDDRQAVALHWKAAREGKSYDITHRIVVNGKTKWVRERAKVELDEAGAPVTLVGSIQDISDTVLLEQQLRQAQKMEAIGTLAGGIAHDFNNILGAIIGYSELLKDLAEEGEPPDWSYLDQVLKASERAKDLVKQILTFSRQTDHDRRPLNVSSIVKEALKLLRGGLPSTIEIVQQAQLESDTIMADATQVHQVIMNLCTNAYHAMPDGGTLTVCLDNIDLAQEMACFYSDITPGRYVRLVVSDTGCGIAPENISRIFDPFFTTKKRGEGTGMGLAVVHGIVKAHGGAITVHSQAGKGTTFEVLFQQVTLKEDNEPTPVTLLPRGTERILLVDDEEQLLDVTTHMLTSLGYEVVTRNNGAKALHLLGLGGLKFDLVITDLTMPVMTGAELARKLLVEGISVPVLLCTGYSERISNEEAVATGFCGMLRKPVSKHDLALAVRRALDCAKA